MVKILNGEIVQDDDPRLQQRHDRAPISRPGSQGAPAAAQTASAGGMGSMLPGFSHGFDFSAPAVQVVPRPDAPGGIPDVDVFALRVPGVGLLGVAAAGAFFGIRGLLAAALLGYLYLRSGGGGAAAPTARGGTAAGAQRSGDGGLFMQQQRQQQQQDPDGFSGGLQQRPGQTSQPAFKGKAYKLGS